MIVQPIIYLVSETYAQVECGTFLVEYQSVPATGTSEIATVVDGQPEVFDAFRTIMQWTQCLQIRTLMLIAITIGAIRYGTL
tara:strand:- start:206 stop:451 length:246 start_codon:yes stop_codon:yes gene_type:complete